MEYDILFDQRIQVLTAKINEKTRDGWIVEGQPFSFTMGQVPYVGLLISKSQLKIPGMTNSTAFQSRLQIGEN